MPVYGINKDTVRGLILAYLYDPLKKVRQGQIDEIIEKNSKFSPNTASFVYGSQTYIHSNYTYSVRHNSPNLHPSLVPEMEQLVKEFDSDLIYEKGIIHSYLNMFLSKSNHIGDYTRFLPEELHQVVRKIDPSSDSTSYWMDQRDVTYLLIKHKRAYDMICNRLAFNVLLTS